MFASTTLKATSLESLRESCGHIYTSGTILMPSPVKMSRLNGLVVRCILYFSVPTRLPSFFVVARRI
jgi:hypothetical protein